MAFSWTSFSATNKINYSQLGNVMELLSQTAKVHEERDLASVPPLTLRELINTPQAYQAPFPAPPATKYNWMQVDYGANDNQTDPFKNLGDIVVVYRLLKHRLKIAPANKMQWSVTVGFDARLLPPPSNLIQQPYAELANVFAGQIKRKMSQLVPVPTEFLMVDDIPSTSDDPAKSKVGKLILTAYSLADGVAYSDLKATWAADSQYVPKSEHNETIPGHNPRNSFVRVTRFAPG